VIASPGAILPPPRRDARACLTRLWRCFDAIGAPPAAGAAALGAPDDGVIGACAQAGAAIAKAAAIATPFKKCFMPLSSVAVPDSTIRCKRRALPEGGPFGPRARNNRVVVSLPRIRNLECCVSVLNW